MPGLSSIANILSRNKFDKKAYGHVLGSSTSLPNMKALLQGIRNSKEMDDLQKAVYILVKIIYELRDVTESKKMMMDSMRDIDSSIEFKESAAGVNKNLSSDVDKLFATFNAAAASNKNAKKSLKKVAKDFGASGKLDVLKATEKMLFNSALNVRPGSTSVSQLNKKEISFENVPAYKQSSRGISLEAVCNWLIDFLSVAHVKLKNKDDDMRFFAGKNLESNNGRPRGDLLTDMEGQKNFFADLKAKLSSARDKFLGEKYSASQKINRESFMAEIRGVLNALEVNIFSHVKGNPFVFSLRFDDLRNDIVKASKSGDSTMQNIKSKTSAALKTLVGRSPNKEIGEKGAKVVSDYNENFLKVFIGLSEKYGEDLPQWLVLSEAPETYQAQIEDLKHISDDLNKISEKTTMKQCKDIIQGTLDHLRLETASRSLSRIRSISTLVMQRVAKLQLILRDLSGNVKKIQQAMSGVDSSKSEKISINDYPRLKTAIPTFYDRTVGDLLFYFGKFSDKRIIKFVDFCLKVRRGTAGNVIVRSFSKELDWLSDKLTIYQNEADKKNTTFNRGYGVLEDTRSEIVKNMEEFVTGLEKVK